MRVELDAVAQVRDWVRIMPGADVDPRAVLGKGIVVWPQAQIREGAVLGDECTVGRGVYVDAGVHIGRQCKLQNNALLYAPARLGDGVFVGPAAVLTNDVHPRAITPSGALKGTADWQSAAVEIADGASVGAGAVVVAGMRIGQWALVGAGAVVTRDVPAFGLVVGNPARRIAWVGRAGYRLEADGEGGWRCPRDCSRYVERDGALEPA